MSLRRILFTIMCALTLTLQVKAQNITSESLQVSLLTCAPGSEVFQLEGHSALRIWSGNFDVTIHWGVFDFNAPNFVYRFVKGETDYSIGIMPTAYFVDDYRRRNRRVTEQILNLTPEQAGELQRMVEVNLQPENRVYRYNYVKDNCATRPLLMIEKAIGDSIVISPSYVDSRAAESFRDIMKRYHRNYPWYQFGIDMALGSGIDYRLDEHEKAFAPVLLQDIAAHASIADSTGVLVPFVRETHILADGPADGVILPPTPWWKTPMAVGIALLLLCVLLSVRDIRRRRVTRCFDSIFYSVYGIAGCIIAYLVFISIHEATSPNIQLLWLNPLSLVAAVGIWVRGMRRVLLWYHLMNIAAIIVFLVMWAFGPQCMLAAFLPFVLADLCRSINYLIVSREQNK